MGTDWYTSSARLEVSLLHRTYTFLPSLLLHPFFFSSSHSLEVKKQTEDLDMGSELIETTRLLHPYTKQSDLFYVCRNVVIISLLPPAQGGFLLREMEKKGKYSTFHIFERGIQMASKDWCDVKNTWIAHSRSSCSDRRETGGGGGKHNATIQDKIVKEKFVDERSVYFVSIYYTRYKYHDARR